MLNKICLALMAMTVVAIAQPGPGKGLKEHREKFSDKLNLTEQQEDQIAELRSKFQLKMIDLRADIQKLELGLKDKFHTDDPDRNAIHKAVDKISEKEGEIQKFRLDHRLDVSVLLTDEQRKTFNSMPMMIHHDRHCGEKDFRMKKIRKHKKPGNRYQSR